MKSPALSIIVPAGVAVVGALVIVFWMSTAPVDGLVRRVPGLDGRQMPGGAEPAAPPEPGEPVAFDGQPSDLSGAWPCFRGASRDAICDDGTPLARDWPDEGPPVFWMIDMLGPGHGGAAVAGGCVYVLDYDAKAEADTMRCLSLDDGREIWRNGYPVAVPENHGMSRTVPAVADGLVVSLGPKCHAASWDASTGQCLWLLDLVGRFGAKVPDWYTGQCPLVEGGRVILAPAGKAFLIAVDCRTGDVVWESPRLHNWEMTHVSIAPMELAGRRMYVYCGTRGAAGISAEDGSVLWETADWVGNMATCPSPLPAGDGRIFFSGGYGAGSVMLGLNEAGGRLNVQTLFRLTPKQFGSEQQTPILFDGHLYGVRTKAGGEQLVCLDLDGKELWNSGTDKFGRGPYLIADGLIYVLGDKGLLTLVEAAPQGYNRFDQFQVFERAHDAWGPMALAGGRLILRDLTRMACLDVARE